MLRVLFFILIYSSSVLWIDFVSLPIFNLMGMNIYPVDLFFIFSIIFFFLIIKEKKFNVEKIKTPFIPYILILIWFLFQILRNIPYYKQSAIGDGRSILYFFFFFITYYYSQKFTPETYAKFSEKILKISALGALLLFIIELYLGHRFSILVDTIKEANFGYLVDPRGVRILGSSDTFNLLIFAVYLILLTLYQGKISIGRIILLLISLIAAFVSQNRTAIISITFGFCIYLLLNYRIKSLIKIFIFVIVILTLVAVFLNYFFPKHFFLSIGEVMTSAFDPFNDKVGTTYWRFLAIQSALEKFAEKPILGEGFGQYWNLYINNEVVFLPPHNEYVTILIKSGIIGLLLLFAIFYKIFKSYFIYKNVIQHNYKPLLDTMFIALISALPYGMGFEFYPYFGLYFGIYLGIIVKNVTDLKKRTIFTGK